MSVIREARPEDLGSLTDLWLRSVRATHHFLSEGDIQSLLPIVRDVALPGLKELWILCDDDGAPAGFMGLERQSVESLFLEPSHLRRGGGRRLLEHARRLKGALAVSVNEENLDALKFYMAQGFELVGRSPVDDEGRPFPLLHLRQSPD